MIDGTFEEIQSTRESLATCIRRFDADAPTTADIATSRPRLVSALRNGGGLVRGAGVVLAPGMLMDARLWIEWWTLDGAGDVRRAAFDFDEDSLDFYDYSRADWYLAPRHGNQRSLVGPYVDFNGINEYIVTATVPVTIDGRFVGVAGADLSVDELERRLHTANRRNRTELAVVNASNRIVASTSPRHVVGSLLRVKTDTECHAIGGISWSVVIVGS
jgi:hypothetical protein